MSFQASNLSKGPTLMCFRYAFPFLCRKINLNDACLVDTTSSLPPKKSDQGAYLCNFCLIHVIPIQSQIDKCCSLVKRILIYMFPTSHEEMETKENPCIGSSSSHLISFTLFCCVLFKLLDNLRSIYCSPLFLDAKFWAVVNFWPFSLSNSMIF